MKQMKRNCIGKWLEVTEALWSEKKSYCEKMLSQVIYCNQNTLELGTSDEKYHGTLIFLCLDYFTQYYHFSFCPQTCKFLDLVFLY